MYSHDCDDSLPFVVLNYVSQVSYGWILSKQYEQLLSNLYRWLSHNICSVISIFLEKRMNNNILDLAIFYILYSRPMLLDNWICHCNTACLMQFIYLLFRDLINPTTQLRRASSLVRCVPVNCDKPLQASGLSGYSDVKPKFSTWEVTWLLGNSETKNLDRPNRRSIHRQLFKVLLFI